MTHELNGTEEELTTLSYSGYKSRVSDETLVAVRHPHPVLTNGYISSHNLDPEDVANAIEEGSFTRDEAPLFILLVLSLLFVWFIEGRFPEAMSSFPDQYFLPLFMFAMIVIRR